MNDWVDAETWIERAQQLSDAHRWAEALEQVNRALDINPNHASWWGSKAFLLDQMERYEEAIDAYDSALEFEPLDREWLTSLGVNCIRTGQFLRALETFDALEKNYPDYEPAYCHRIMLYSELGEHDVAEQMFYMAQQIDENCPHCFWNLGCSLWARHELLKAIWCWQKTLDIEPNYRGARRRIAQAYRRLNDHTMACEYYLAEFREDPRDVGTLIELAEMYLEIGQPEKTIQKCAQISDIDPYCVRAYVLMGDAYDRLGEDVKATQAYEQAADIEPELHGLHYKLGTKLMALGRHSDAKQQLMIELDLQPNDRAVLMAAGNCALELEDPDTAQRCFERLIDIDDCLPGAYHNLAVCHFLRNEYEDGIRQCELALELKADYALARQKLVLANMQVGHWRRAKHLLDDGLLRDPHNAVLLKLRKKWAYRRFSQWAAGLAYRVRALVKPDQSC